MATLPLIGITCAVQPVNERPQAGLNTTYVEAVLAGGGVPVILPTDVPAQLVPACLDRLDGLIISGGGDIDPALFGQERHPKLGQIDPHRDSFELSAARYAREKGLPTLGICRGEQVMVVALGGTLWQDIPSQLPQSIIHRYPSDTEPHQRHPITLAQGSLLASIMGAEAARVNTFHHQAAQNLAGGMIASAWAEDSVIEGVEASDGFFLGVQWHPERLVKRDEKALALFKALVQAANHRG